MTSYICRVCGKERDTLPAAAMCCAPKIGEEEAAEVVVEPEPEAPLPEAPELLGRAARHMHDRAATYDTLGGERSMGKAVRAFNAITGRELTEAEGWLLLQVLKDVRLFTRPNYHADSAEDCIAYAALKAEAKSKGL